MNRFFVLFALLFIGSVVCNRYWNKLDVAVDKNIRIPITIGLKQQNLDVFQSLFEQISSPKSKLYQRFLTVEEIADLIAPEEQDILKVQQYILNNSQNQVDMEITRTRDYIKAEMTVGDVERIFNVEMKYFRHYVNNNRILIRSTEYYKIPVGIRNEVDLLSMVSDFPAEKMSVYNKKKRLLEQQKEESADTIFQNYYGYPQSDDKTLFAVVYPVCSNGKHTTDPTNLCSDQGSQVSYTTLNVYNNATGQLVSNTMEAAPFQPGTCEKSGIKVSCNLAFNTFPLETFELYSISIQYTYQDSTTSPEVFFPTPLVTSPFVTPQYIWEQYQIPSGIDASYSSQSVAEFDQQYFSLTDLDYFCGNTSVPTPPTSTVGPNNENETGDEATLDIQWIAALGINANTTFWSIKQPGYLIEWANELIEATNPPLVHSISYGANEEGSPAFWRDRVDTEFQKLGNLGLSVMVSAGDAGATNIGHGSESCTPLQPQYPSTSPYVTTVSATFFTSKYDPICSNTFFGNQVSCNGATREVAVSADIGMDWTTGGGFSNHSSRPSYQDTAVSNYLTNFKNLLPSLYFNQNGRAYPDVSAVGHNLLIIQNGNVDVADGTSASSPIFAGIISLVNSGLIENNGKPLGFLNPILYQVQEEYPESFFDVTVGGNACGDVLHPPYLACCDEGFQSSLGWDPVTGLGTPIFKYFNKAINEIINKSGSN